MRNRPSYLIPNEHTLQLLGEKFSLDFVDVRYEDKFKTAIYQSKQGNDSNVYRQKLVGSNVRVLMNGNWGTVSFTPSTSFDIAVYNARKLAVVRDSKSIDLASVPSLNVRTKCSPKNDPKFISIDKKIELLNDYEQKIHELSKALTAKFLYQEEIASKRYINSEGSYIELENSYVSIDITIIGKSGGNIQMANGGIGATNNFSHIENADAKIESLAKSSMSLLSSKEVEEGHYTVVLDPELTGVFVHEVIGHNSEADNTPTQEFTTDKETKEMHFVKSMNVVDDPTLVNLSGTYSFDDEGVAPSKVYLIRSGVFADKLNSREMAGLTNETPNGHARAVDYRFTPIVRMGNTYMEAGDYNFEEMIEDVKKGIYAVGPWEGQCKDGTFILVPQVGYLISNGVLSETVRDFRIWGKYPSVLSQIDAIGDQVEVFGGGRGGCVKRSQGLLQIGAGGPHLRIQNLTVTQA
jgi:TldD protein